MEEDTKLKRVGLIVCVVVAVALLCGTVYSLEKRKIVTSLSLNMDHGGLAVTAWRGFIVVREVRRFYNDKILTPTKKVAHTTRAITCITTTCIYASIHEANKFENYNSHIS